MVSLSHGRRSYSWTVDINYGVGFDGKFALKVGKGREVLFSTHANKNVSFLKFVSNLCLFKYQ